MAQDPLAASTFPSAYQNTGGVVPDWLNKGDNAWQLTAATLVGLQSIPGLVILYGSIVKKKWAVNSAFMALYAFAATLLCWVTWAYKMSFGNRLFPLWGKAGTTLLYTFLLKQAELASTIHLYANDTVEMHSCTSGGHHLLITRAATNQYLFSRS